MKMRLFVCAIILGLFFLVAGCGSGEPPQAIENPPAGKTDAQEGYVEEESDARIIATTVALTEIMDELELDLVGIPTSYKDLPERYAGVTEVGNPMDPDMEIVMSLKPTHVLTVTTLLSDLEAVFSETDLHAHFVDLESVDGMFDEILALGEQYDRTEQAEELVHRFEDKMTEIEEKISGEEPPTVLILMGIPGSYIVGTGNSYIGDLVERAGGVNAVTDREEEYISANTEYLQQLNPDVILRAAHGMPDEVVKMFDKEFKENDIWSHFKAVQNDRVYDLEETLFGTTANLAAAEALDELINILYADDR